MTSRKEGQMIHYLELAFKRFGNTVHLEQDGNVLSYKAFIQPLRHRHMLYLKSRISINCSGNNRYLLYIGPKDRPLNSNLRLSCKGTYNNSYFYRF